MAEGVIQRSHTAVTRIKSQASSYKVCGGPSATGRGYSPSNVISFYRYHSTNPLSIACTKKTAGGRGSSQSYFPLHPT